MSNFLVNQRQYKWRDLWKLWVQNEPNPEPELPVAVRQACGLNGPKVLGLRVPRELISASLPAGGMALVPSGRALPETAPSHRVRYRSTMPALNAFRAKEASKYPDTVSKTALAVVSLHGCKFACGEPGNSDFAFCNKPRTRGPYCSKHHEMTHFTKPWGSR